jgi:hypothetical protein
MTLGNSWFYENYKTAAKKWDRAVCLELIRFNRDLREEVLVGDDIFVVLDDLEDELQVLRDRLPAAQNQNSPSNDGGVSYLRVVER